MRFFICILLFLFTSPIQLLGDDHYPSPDLIGCLKSVDSLDDRYRNWMQINCVGVAGDICSKEDMQGGTCTLELFESMNNFFSELQPLLPMKIEGKGFVPKSYDRALKRVTVSFENTVDCSNETEVGNATCDFTTLGSATIDLFNLAKYANISLP